MNTLRHQYLSNGSQHRVVQLDIGGFLLEAGVWTSCLDLAIYCAEGRVFAAAAKHPDVPVNQIFELTPVAKEINGGSEGK